VLGHLAASLGQVEDLADLSCGNRRLGEGRSTPGAAIRNVMHDVVGVSHLGQVRSGVSGLLAGPTGLLAFVGFASLGRGSARLGVIA
jgi:hypothetical protein